MIHYHFAPKVLMLDLSCIVPYYTGVLCQQLHKLGISVNLGSTTYRFDPQYFEAAGLKLQPGLVDFAGRARIPFASIRRGLKVVELGLNMTTLSFRFLLSRPRIVHVQYLALLDMGIPIERWFIRFWHRLGVKIIYTVHNELPFDTRDRHKRAFQRTYSEADALICHARQTKTALVARYGIEASRIHIIPHGPLFAQRTPPSREESRARLGLVEGECVFLLHGWLKPYKGLRFLLESWRELKLEPGKARLLIVGGGEEKLVREVQDQIAASGLADTVSLVAEFVHPTAELPYYLQAADVNVLPYQEITTSAALMTVVPYAKPIIATDLPFFRELLGDVASLVPFGDCQRLAQEIRGLALNPTERDRLSLRIVQRFDKRKFSWEQIAEQTAECYRHAAS